MCFLVLTMETPDIWITGYKGTSVTCHLVIAGDTTVQFSSVTQSCLNLCNPLESSTPGLPVHHQLPEFTQTHVH